MIKEIAFYGSITALTACTVVIIRKSFSVIRCTEKSGSFVLAGQFKNGISSAFLPNPRGQHKYIINSKGPLRLNHHSFNPDGGTWSLPPGHGEQEYFNIRCEGIYTYIINIGESYDKLDRLELVNPSLWEEVEFSYRVD